MTEPAPRVEAPRAAPPVPPPAPEEPKATPEPKKIETRPEVNLKTFKIGDTVFYWQDGVWETGKLEILPVKKRGIITMTVDGVEVELEVAPYRVEFPRSTGLTIGGKEYTVRKVYPGENGEPLYDLVTGDPADLRRGVDEEIVRIWKSSGDGKAGLERQVAESKEAVKSTVDRLLEEVKLVQGRAASGLVKPLVKLEQKVLDMEKALAETGEDEAGLKAAGKAVKNLRREVETEVVALERQIKAVLAEERAVEAGKGRREVADIALRLFEEKAQKIDADATKSHGAALRAWESAAAAYNEWKVKVEAQEKKAGAGKDKKEKGKGKKEDKDKAKEDKDKEEVEKLKALKDSEPDKPGEKPTLKKPSDEKRAELFEEVFRDFSGLSGVKSELKENFKKLQEETVIRRRAAAKKTGRDDFPVSTIEEKAEYKKETFKQFDAVVADWARLPEKVEPINLAAEKEELEQKAASLDTQAYDLDRDDIRRELVDIVGDAVERASIKVLTSAEDVVDIWHALGIIEIKLARAASGKRPEAERVEHKESEGVVDLPQEIVKEMLLLNPDGIKAAMEEAYAVLYTPERNQTRLEELLRNFFRNINIDAGPEKTPTLRQRLKQNSIENWESFVKKFEGPLAEKFSGVILEAAKAELRTFLSQKIGDIKKLSGDERTWGEAVKDNIIDYSALSKMKGAMALRYLTNTLLIGGVGVATGIGVKFIPFLPGGAKAAAVGGVVGFVKGLTQRWMGKDEGYFQGESKRAQAAAEADKKKLIADTLIKRTFKIKADGTADLAHATELSHFFAASLRRATEKDHGKLEIKNESGAVAVTLTGDAVCMYQEALKCAAATEGLEVEEKTRLEFARALHALHNNKKKVVDTPPYLATGLQWLTDSYSGRAKTKEGKEGETAQIGGERQLAITMVLGAGVAYAAMMDSSAVRVGIGATYGILKGQQSQYEADRRTSDRESRANLSEVVTDVSDLLKKGPEATPEDLVLVKDYRDLLAALLGGKKFSLPPAGPVPSNLSKEDARLMSWFSAHSLDAASFLERDEKMRAVLESTQREISRSGFLERQTTELKTSFTDTLRSMKSANERLGKEAKNSRWVETKRFFKRGIRSAVYGAIGAGVSYGIGRGVEAIRHHFAPPVEAPAPSEVAVVPVATETVPVAPPSPEHPVEFPSGSEVHAGEGITHPLARQLLDKFNDDVAHNHQPTITLENGHEYQFHGNIHNEKDLDSFAVKVSAEMAKLKGDINLKAGTENWLKFMGEGKGHVVLTHDHNQFGYEIQNEEMTTPHHLGAAGHHPVAGEAAPAGTNPREPAASLAPHSGSGASAPSLGDVTAANREIHAAQEQIARENAFRDWAVSDPNIQRYVTANIITSDQLEDMAKNWGKTHSAGAPGSSHADFISAVRDRAAGMPLQSGLGSASAADVAPSPIHAAPSTPRSEVAVMEPPAGGGKAAIPAAANLAPPVGAEDFAVTADHPVAIEPQGNDRVVHFLDQKDHQEHTAAISEKLSPNASNDEHNPLLIKLTASGRPIPARLEMHIVPGSFDPKPVVVVETFGDNGATENVYYSIVDKTLEKMEEPPSTARLLTP